MCLSLTLSGACPSGLAESHSVGSALHSLLSPPPSTDRVSTQHCRSFCWLWLTNGPSAQLVVFCLISSHGEHLLLPGCWCVVPYRIAAEHCRKHCHKQVTIPSACQCGLCPRSPFLRFLCQPGGHVLPPTSAIQSMSPSGMIATIDTVSSSNGFSRHSGLRHALGVTSLVCNCLAMAAYLTLLVRIPHSPHMTRIRAVL